jgi:prepilin signal peptidase PulO-like enzyme (type II secretory pathway)
MSGTEPQGIASARLEAETRLGVGLAASVLAAAAFTHFGLGARGLIGATLCAFVVLFAAFDLERRVIPTRIAVAAVAVVLLAQVVLFPGQALEWIAATAGAGLVLGLPRVVRRDAIGSGDVWLGMLLGAGLGAEMIPALLFGSLAAAPVALWMHLRRGDPDRVETIPLAPFLAIGAVLALFLGDLPS